MTLTRAAVSSGPFSLGDEHESGFETKSEAELALQKALARSDAEKAKRAEDAAKSAGPLFAQYFEHWLKEHASRRCAPKTLERYADLGAYLIRELGKVRLNEMTTAEIQAAIHRLQDHGGRRTETEPRGRPLAPKTVRHMGTLLYTVLSDADRLGVLKIPNPMANRRVLLPKLTKRRPAVLDATKLQALFESAQNTRLYPLVVLAAAADKPFSVAAAQPRATTSSFLAALAGDVGPFPRKRARRVAPFGLGGGLLPGPRAGATWGAGWRRSEGIGRKLESSRKTAVFGWDLEPISVLSERAC